MTTANRQAVGIKETLTSLTIAFMLAFVFRGFVIEGFIIPTGSMAPTLLGKHVRFTSEYNGYDWTTRRWQASAGVPLRMQGADGQQPLTPTDPMTLLPIEPQRDRRLAAGDRVFVLKYLPGLNKPERWDVVVFKNPGTHENFIKRLVALPGEQVAMVDGDIFTRPFNGADDTHAGPDAWRETNWDIARKDERTQRAMFQPVFDSRFAPLRPEPTYRSPISSDDPGRWSGVQDRAVWTYSGSGETELYWNNQRPITDRYSYNQDSPNISLNSRPDAPTGSKPPYPVSDLNAIVSVEPGDAPVSVTASLRARSHFFEGIIDAQTGTATVRMRPFDQPDAWTDLHSAPVDAPEPGHTSLIEFWHVDQALWLFVDGDLVCGGPEDGAYTLSPAQRIGAAMVPSYDELVSNTAGGDGVTAPGVFARPELYRNAEVRWSFKGGPFTVHRAALQRDIFYQPSPDRTRPTRGAHYNNSPVLNSEQYFMCGDNSPNSEDSRYWTSAMLNPWIRQNIDPTPGVVNRDLIVGQAFVVYFPAPLDGGPILAPDFGRLRWIW